MNMLRKNNSDIFLRRKRAFVNAASKLIQTQPFDSISIRKIAEEAGFHNSTIYSYFQDADWLLALASVGHLQPYSDDLLIINNQDLSPYDHFYTIWNCFCRHAFSNPALYYNFFFGKYKYHLTELIEEYYSLFPDMKNEHSPRINAMFLGSNMQDRCLSILQPLADDPKTRLTENNLSWANFIIVSTLEEYLANQIRGADEFIPETDDDHELIYRDIQEDFRKPTAEFLEMLHFIVDR